MIVQKNVMLNKCLPSSTEIGRGMKHRYTHFRRRSSKKENIYNQMFYSGEFLFVWVLYVYCYI